jgi:methionine-gamma-lyase
VQKVNYPGLANHPQHLLARRQMIGWGGMLSFEIKGGVEAGRRLMNNLSLCSLAVSLGSVDTLVEHPASMTHAVMPRETRESLGISDGLVRVSVGIEDAEDILADFERGLEMV